MRDLLSWSLNLGRWAGVQVRMHALFLLLVVLILFDAARRGEFAWYGTFLGLLTLSLLVHEIAHCLAAVRVGGTPRQIVLWPLGGLVQVSVPREPLRECAVALAGPLANLLLVVAAAIVLHWQGFDVLARTSLFAPPGVPELTPLSALHLALWINLWLLVVNLLPALPMDGGRALRSGLRFAVGHNAAEACTARAAQLTGLAICVAAWFVPHDEGVGQFAWLPLVALGIFLFFSARHEPEPESLLDEEDEGPSGYDLSQGYPGATSRHRDWDAPVGTQSGYVGQWLETRREERRRRQQEIEREEDRMVDEILARLHESGIDDLSPEERALLERASARYRERPRD